MTWQEALEITVGQTKHERYRELTAEDHPDHDHWRAFVLAKASGQSAPAYPSLREQAGNALAAVRRVAGAIAQGQPLLAPDEVLAQRQGICQACEHWNTAARRCRKCGCYGLKLQLATERCPLDPPKWRAVP